MQIMLTNNITNRISSESNILSLMRTFNCKTDDKNFVICLLFVSIKIQILGKSILNLCLIELFLKFSSFDDSILNSDVI